MFSLMGCRKETVTPAMEREHKGIARKQFQLAGNKLMGLVCPQGYLLH
jgi:hypothetical protein